MILFTARILRPGEYPLPDGAKKSSTIMLASGKQLYLEVSEVVAAFEIEGD